MRADRLVTLVLLLRQHQRLSASTLARELEVSSRTVLRDIEALSVAGVPVYAERGRHGGFSLLPGFQADLAGLSQDEVLALLVVGSRTGSQAFGLGPALSTALRKVVDAIPESSKANASDAARRLLIDPATDLSARPSGSSEVPERVMRSIRDAVLNGNKLRIHYGPVGMAPSWRTVDPVGLVTVRDRGYLLATRAGQDRTYRLSRVLAAEVLPDQAQRPDRVDLDRLWRERGDQFRSGCDPVSVVVRVSPGERTHLVEQAVAAEDEVVEVGGWSRAMLTFTDARHAEWAMWQVATDAEVIEPEWLRDALRAKAIALRSHYGELPEP